MKVIRIYDDRKVFYNNIALSELCSEEVAVEYCTFDKNKPSRTIVDKLHNDKAVDNWVLNQENEYYVFLDTRWDKRLINETVEINKVTIPKGLIDQLKQNCVIKLWVYTTYDKNEGEKLVNGLSQTLGDKIKNNLLVFNLFQPDESITQIRQELEQWINI